MIGPSGFPYGTDSRECKSFPCVRLGIKACACNGSAFNGVPFSDRLDLLSEITLKKMIDNDLDR
jgi:hypothetical protein